MKKVNRILAIVALVAISISTIVASPRPAAIYISKSKEAKKIILNLENMSAETVTCSFINEEGSVIFRDKIETANKTAKQYNLSQLPEGEYTIEVDDLMKIERLNLTVDYQSVTLKERVADVTFKPTVVVKKNNTVDLNLLALGDAATVTFYGPQGNLLQSDRFSNVNVITKRYNLIEAEAGNYRVVISHKGETFSYNIAI